MSSDQTSPAQLQPENPRSFPQHSENLRARSHWAVNVNGDVFRYAPDSDVWTNIPGAPSLVRISAGSSTNVWGVAGDDNIYRYTGDDNNPWDPIPGSLTDISVASDGTVWGVNRNGTVYRWAD